MTNDRKQIRALCRPLDVFEGDYLNVMGLLHRIKEYQLKPFWKMSGDIQAELLKDEDVIEVEYIGEAGLTVIKTILPQETLEEMLSDLVDGEFRLESFSRVDELGAGEDPFYGVLDWRVEDDG